MSFEDVLRSAEKTIRDLEERNEKNYVKRQQELKDLVEEAELALDRRRSRYKKSVKV